MGTFLARLLGSANLSRMGLFLTTFVHGSFRGARLRGAGWTGLIIAALVVGSAPAVEAAGTSQVTWTQLNPATSPSGRMDAVMAYDPATTQLVLFGGELSNGVNLDDTWTWNGTIWSQLSPATSPSARAGGVMAYDPATRQLITFGGRGNTGRLGDTWSWTGTTWSQLSPATSPQARAGYVMAYDPATRQLILFSGGVSSQPPQSDTWVWTGTTWSQLSPATSPSARFGGVITYDPVTSQLVLFGGNGSLDLTQPQNDTWTWTGTTWSQVTPTTSPPARSDAKFAYDTATKQLLLFTGYSGVSLLDDTWTYG